MTPAPPATGTAAPGATPSAGTQSCPDVNLTASDANLDRVRAATACLINAIRVVRGLRPLIMNERLTAGAQSFSAQMVAQDFFAHVSPAGLAPLTRILATGYVPLRFSSFAWGENIAWGTDTLATPLAIVTAWFNSPEHLVNILNGAFRDTGIGVAPAAPRSLSGGDPGATYTQEFGVVNT